MSFNKVVSININDFQITGNKMGKLVSRSLRLKYFKAYVRATAWCKSSRGRGIKILV